MTREEAAKYIKNRCIGSASERDGTEWSDAMWAAIEALSADRPTGNWVKISPAHIYECSVCGQMVMTDDIDCYSYCHNCGARMDDEKAPHQAAETIEDVLPKNERHKLSNREWKEFLSRQFDISKTSAKEMLHGMMRWKKEDNFKRIFNPIRERSRA